MDPVTAFCLAIKAFCEMVTEISKGQPPEVRAELWKRYLEFDTRMRKLFRIDDSGVVGEKKT